jgi:hypothetical protein
MPFLLEMPGRLSAQLFVISHVSGGCIQAVLCTKAQRCSCSYLQKGDPVILKVTSDDFGFLPTFDGPDPVG